MFNDRGTVTIESDRLILRKFSIDDAEDMFHNWASDSAVVDFLSWEPHSSIDVTRQVISTWISAYESDSTYNWCIVMKDTGKAIGHISATQINEKNQRCELDYLLGKAYWNKGIMTEALKLVIDFLFDEVGINRIQAKHDIDNPASGKVMQKAGMKYEGTLRQYRKRRNGTFGCSSVYSHLKGER